MKINLVCCQTVTRVSSLIGFTVACPPLQSTNIRAWLIRKYFQHFQTPFTYTHNSEICDNATFFDAVCYEPVKFLNN